jgi:hypothetical protein
MPTTIQALILGAMIAGTPTADGPSGTRLLRQPDVSRDRIAFIHAGDLWTVPRGRGPARRLTTTAEAVTAATPLPLFVPVLGGERVARLPPTP